MSQSDRDLLVRVARAARRHDPVPATVVAAASDAFFARAVRRHVAGVVFDSGSHRALAGVRGAGPRQVTLEAPGVVVEVELDGAGGQIVGQIIPAGEAMVQIVGEDDPVPKACTCDDLGRFQISDVAPGRFRLRVLHPTEGGRTATDTPWLTI